MLGKVIAMGLGMMFLTTMIHAIFMVGEMKAARWRLSRFGRVNREVRKAVLVSSLTAWMFLAIVIEAWLWTIVYLYNPLITALSDMETAFYFSMVTFTTLGYGDVVLVGKSNHRSVYLFFCNARVWFKPTTEPGEIRQAAAGKLCDKWGEKTLRFANRSLGTPKY